MAKSISILERRFVPKGTTVVHQGDAGYSAYLLQSGSVSVFTLDNGREVELAKLEVGQIFGEMALIFDEPRSASVKTLEDCNLIVITRDAFKGKLDRSDPTIRAIVSMLTQRILTANNAMINRKETLDDLRETSRIIYENFITALPANQQRSFESSVLPKLDEFMEAVQAFQEKYSG